jgi:uncharacterized membrane protein YgcG
MKDNTELEDMVQNWLDELKPVPPRNPKVAAQGRARFLAQAVSASEFQRHKGWTSIFRKERFAMNMLMSILIIAGLLFGGGATVNAAQDDLPNDPLYGVKTWSEEVSLQFQKDPETKVDRLMELIQIRVQEMTQLIDSGQTPPDQVRIRLEEHMRQAFQLCSNMDDLALDQRLLQLRALLQQQERDIERLQLHASQNAQPILERTRAMLQTRLQLVEDGLLNHEMFRNTVRHGPQYGPTQIRPTSAPVTTSTPRGPQNGQATPQLRNPGNGNGPGPNPDPGAPNPEVTPMQNNPENGNNGLGGNESGGNGTGGENPGSIEPGGNGNGGEDTGGNGSGGDGTGGGNSGGKGP